MNRPVIRCKIFDERRWLGWTVEQSLYYLNGLSEDDIFNWKPITTKWSHEYVKH
jgi:hypothetical protein